MAWTTSGLYIATWVDALDATQTLLDLSLTSHKWALYNNTIVPNFVTDAAYTTTNEISGTGYTAGGKDLSGLTPSIAYTTDNGGVVKYTHAAIAWTTATITANGAILYADANTSGNGVADALIVGVTFGGTYTSTAGTFTITPHANGVFTLDLTP